MLCKLPIGNPMIYLEFTFDRNNILYLVLDV